MYFLNSPFLDDASNNGTLKMQAGASDPELVWNRKKFEARLDKLAGTEYRVVDGPESSYGPDGRLKMENPVWVIRKQIRTKRKEDPKKIGKDEPGFKVTSVEATYFVMGEFIYMAPSLEDIIRVRIVSFLWHFL